jgi:peptidoglycan/LPS O-acetylase OafA/YrhL
MLEFAKAGYSPWLGFAAAFTVALTLGTVINRVVERPAGEAIIAWWKRRRDVRLATANAATIQG